MSGLRCLGSFRRGRGIVLVIRAAEVKRKQGKTVSIMHKIEELKNKGTQRKQGLKEKKKNKEKQQMGILRKLKK